MKHLLLASCLLCAVSVAAAETPAFDPITTRQAGFDFMGGAVDAMKAGVAANADPKSFASSAGAMARWARIIPTLFPTGSDHGHDTKAKPEIWSDPDGFQRAALGLATAAERLEAAAKAVTRRRSPTRSRQPALPVANATAAIACVQTRHICGDSLAAKN
jgi:cytochrome c556